MCFQQGQRVISPSDKLNNMLWLLKVLLGINILCGCLRIFYGDFNGMLSDFLTSMILLCAIFNLNFISMSFYLFFCLMNELWIAFDFGGLFQYIIQKKKTDTRLFVAVSIMFFIVVFYIIATWRAFITYREMKALYFEQNVGMNFSQGPGQRLREDDEQQRPQAVNQQSQQRQGFQAFSGRGYVVGQ